MFERFLICCILVLICSQCASPKKKQNLEERDWRFFYRTALEWQRKGRCDKAIEEFKKAVKLEPKQGEVWNYLGLAQFSCKLYPEAVESYHKALEITPFYTDVHNNLGILYGEMGKSQDALMEFNEALRDKKYPAGNVYYNVGMLYLRMEDYGSALEALESACLLKPEMFAWRHHLGLVFEKSGDDKAALEAFEKVLETQPDYAPSLFQAALLYMKANNKSRAKDYFTRVIGSSPGSDLAQEAKQHLREIGAGK